VTYDVLCIFPHVSQTIQQVKQSNYFGFCQNTATADGEKLIKVPDHILTLVNDWFTSGVDGSPAGPQTALRVRGFATLHRWVPSSNHCWSRGYLYRRPSGNLENRHLEM